MPDFLLEIGCEEIPARMIQDAEMTLLSRVALLLRRAELWREGEAHASSIETLSTPRRLGLIVRDILPAQPDKTEQVTGPPLKVAKKDGRPTAAGEAFSKKVGVPWEQLRIVNSAKGDYLAAEVARKGRTAAEMLAEGLPTEMASLNWPKSMYWRQQGELFVRPVRWLLAILDGDVIPFEFDGIRAGRETRGHRTLGPAALDIPAPDAYVDSLRKAKVLGAGEREQQIRKALDAASRTIPGARWREDKNLVNTVVNLTEFPSVVLGSFDPEFLTLPEEVLVTVMRDHQKYFAVEDSDHKLLPHFLAVLNTDGDPQGIIRHGHERVLRARFNDARFFWKSDQKHSLRERVTWLKQMTFQKDLGSYYEKTRRVQRVCSWLAEKVRQSGIAIRPGVLHKAACLAKTDLTTELVKEFTELQGIVGGLYARAQILDHDMKEDARQAIATAIYDHYKPESMEDSVPRTIEGAVLSIADKADTIAGMFALGLQPTGSKDPFALRRQANGIIKTVAEHKLPLNLEALFEYAREAYRGSIAEKKFSAGLDYANALRPFLRERLEFYLRNVGGFEYDVVNAVLAGGADDVADAIARAEAVTQVRPSEDFESISVAFKRIKNILRQASETRKQVAAAIDPNLLCEPAERELAATIPRIAEGVEALRGERRYQEALREISRLRPTVDTLFDKVMVMVEDERLRANRLALLQTLLKEFSTIADFSLMVTEKEKSIADAK